MREAGAIASAPIAVTGAAGKTGRAVVAALADRGARVRALVHGADQARTGIAGAGEAIAVDLADQDAVADALQGAAAVYLMAPNMHPDEAELLNPVIDVCEQDARRVVYHSVIHPYAPGMPHHVAKAHVEARLAESSLDWTILQPASYFENAWGVWDSVRRDGDWPVPYSAEAPFTPVALADVAEVAAQMLLDGLAGLDGLVGADGLDGADGTDGTCGTGGAGGARQHRFATYELSGPQVLSTREMAQVAAAELGHEVTVSVDRDPAAAAARPERLQAMFDYYDAHGICGNPTILAMLLGREPTTWRDWVRRHR